MLPGSTITCYLGPLSHVTWALYHMYAIVTWKWFTCVLDCTMDVQDAAVIQLNHQQSTCIPRELRTAWQGHVSAPGSCSSSVTYLSSATVHYCLGRQDRWWVKCMDSNALSTQWLNINTRMAWRSRILNSHHWVIINNHHQSRVWAALLNILTRVGWAVITPHSSSQCG